MRYFAHSGNDPGEHEPVVLNYYDWNPETRTWAKTPIHSGPSGVAPGTGLQIRVADLDRRERLMCRRCDTQLVPVARAAVGIGLELGQGDDFIYGGDGMGMLFGKCQHFSAIRSLPGFRPYWPAPCMHIFLDQMGVNGIIKRQL